MSRRKLSTVDERQADPEVAALEDTPKQFLLAEYEALRAEILAVVDEVRKLEIGAGIAVAILFGWFATQKLQAGLAWHLPVLVPLLGAARGFALTRHLIRLSLYIMTIERRMLAGSGHVAWETTLRAEDGHQNLLMNVTGHVYWAILTTVTAGISHLLQIIVHAKP